MRKWKRENRKRGTRASIRPFLSKYIMCLKINTNDLYLSENVRFYNLIHSSSSSIKTIVLEQCCLDNLWDKTLKVRKLA